MKSRHNHQHCKGFIFDCIILFNFAPQYSLLRLVLLRLLIHCNFLSIHSEASTSVLEKCCFIFRDTCQLLLWKQLLRKFLCKTSIVESFLSTLAVLEGSFSKDYLQQPFCTEPASACLCKKETPMQTSEDYRVLWL